MAQATIKVQIGDAAPDFALPSQDGKTVRLIDFKGQKEVVLYFYPKDETPGCTKEACTFRDSFEVFVKEGAVVIGVSSDSAESHKQFASKYKLPFILLADRGGEIRRRYGVPSTLGILPGRVTYVIDKKGIVRTIFSSQFNAAQHVTEALKVVKELK